MIRLTRLDGSSVVVNADLIETVEATPDTVLHLVNGNRYIVHESVDELVEQVMAFRSRILELGSQNSYRAPTVVGSPPAAPVADLSAVEHLGHATAGPPPAVAAAPAPVPEPTPAQANEAAISGEGDDPWIR